MLVPTAISLNSIAKKKNIMKFFNDYLIEIIFHFLMYELQLYINITYIFEKITIDQYFYIKIFSVLE